MSFNSVTLIIATIIFVILLSMVGYFIYQDQKSKFDIIPSSCPDYWTFVPAKGGFPDACSPSLDQTNWGSCTQASPPPPYSSNPKSTKMCNIFEDKYNFINNNTANPCTKSITWDGVTNNPDLISKCMPS